MARFLGDVGEWFGDTYDAGVDFIFDAVDEVSGALDAVASHEIVFSSDSLGVERWDVTLGEIAEAAVIAAAVAPAAIASGAWAAETAKQGWTSAREALQPAARTAGTAYSTVKPAIQGYQDARTILKKLNPTPEPTQQALLQTQPPQTLSPWIVGGVGLLFLWAVSRS